MDEKRLSKVKDFAFIAHNKQVRRYTGEQYYNHLDRVCNMVSQFKNKYKWIEEVAICHDLFEDTKFGFYDLYYHLIALGYKRATALFICSSVLEMTNIYTHEKFPHYDRKKRKLLEADRMKHISPLAQTIKYADIIDNAKSIHQYDLNFYKVYRDECLLLLEFMDKGEQSLRIKALQVLKMPDNI